MSPDTISPHHLFTAPVAVKQRIAEELYHRYGADLLRSGDVFTDLEVLKNDAQLLGRHMEAIGMNTLCIRCAAGSGSGCCSLFMAGETDAVQLLMNMLAGITVRQVRNDGEHCCYLGDKGCLFAFKPMFCLNYNCSAIYEAVSPDDMRKLEQLTGRLLGKQYEMEKRLLDLVNPRVKSDNSRPG